MSTALREAALAAVAARLTAILPDAVVERARRAPVDTDSDALPRFDEMPPDSFWEPYE